MILFLIIFLLVIFYLLWLEVRKFQIDRKLNNMKSVPSIPILGSGYLLIGKNAEDMTNLTSYYIEKYSTPFKVWIGPFLAIVMVEPNDIQFIINSPNFSERAYIYKFVPHSDGLLTAPDDKHKINRKQTVGIFSTKLLQIYMPIIEKGSRRLVEILQNKLNQGYSTDLFKYIVHYVTEISTVSFLDYDIEIQGTEIANKLYDALRDYLHVVVNRAYAVWQHPDFIYKLTRNYRETKKYEDIINNYTKGIIRQKEQMLGQETYKNDKENSNTKDMLFIEKCFKLLQNGTFDYDQYEALIYGILFGGFDTIGNVLASTLLMLAIHQDVQERVIEEILNTHGEDLSKNVDPFVVRPYLDMVLKEVMRLFPIAPIIARQCSKDTEYNGYTIPANTTILIPVYDLQRSTKLWGPNANEFNPENFSPENIERIHPWAWIPFSGGRKGCIGKRFAWLALRQTTVRLLLHFKFTSDLKMADVRVSNTLMLSVVNRDRINIEKRQFN